MCYNKETSLVAFIGSLFVSSLLLNRNKLNDKVIALFLLTISLIQLIEFFIWKNINNKKLNKFYTRIARILTLLQPICMLLILYIYGTLIIPNSELRYPILIIFIYTIYLIYDLFTEPQTLSVVSKVNKNLSWGTKDIVTSERLLWQLCYISIVIFSPLLLKPRLLAYVFTMISLIIAIFSYIQSTREIDLIHKTSWKSLWCFLSLFLFLFYYLFTQYYKY